MNDVPRPAVARPFQARKSIWPRKWNAKWRTNWASNWSLRFFLLLAFALVGLGTFVFSPDWVQTDGDLPVGLRSPLKANYAMDPRQFSLPPVSTEIVGEALTDRVDPAQPGDPTSQLATLMVEMRSPVPTITPLPGRTSVPTLAGSSTAEPLLPSPASTTTALPTAASSATQMPSPTYQPSATATRLIPVFPTATFRVITAVPTREPEPTRAYTEPAPTAAATQTLEPTSSIPSATATSVATSTPIPPAYPIPPDESPTSPNPYP